MTANKQEDIYNIIAKAWAEPNQKGAAPAANQAKSSDDTVPPVFAAPAPNLADKLGIKAIRPDQMQTLAMLAVAQAAETRGFQSGIDAKQAEIDAKAAQQPGILQSALTTFLNGTEGMDPSQIPPIFNSANKKDDVVDKTAAAAKKTTNKLLKLATAFVIANLPEELRPKE